MTKPIELIIYSAIEWGSAARHVADIRTAGTAPITLRLNSPGGSVFDGCAIYNALASHKPGVTVVVEGLAASIAAYIAMAGTTVRMAANALLMLHNPWMSLEGDAKEMRSALELLERHKTSIVAAFVKRSAGKLSEAQIIAMMDAETWLSAEESKKWGFADEVTETLSLAACARFDLSGFRHAPPQLREKVMDRNAVYREFDERLKRAQGRGERVAVLADLERYVREGKAGAGSGLVPASLLAERDARIVTLDSELAHVKGELVTVNAALAKSNKLMELMEGFCGVKGVDPKFVPPAMSAPEPSKTYAEYDRRYKQANSPEERANIMQQLEDDALAGRIMR